MTFERPCMPSATAKTGQFEQHGTIKISRETSSGKPCTTMQLNTFQGVGMNDVTET